MFVSVDKHFPPNLLELSLQRVERVGKFVNQNGWEICCCVIVDFCNTVMYGMNVAFCLLDIVPGLLYLLLFDGIEFAAYRSF